MKRPKWAVVIGTICICFIIEAGSQKLRTSRPQVFTTTTTSTTTTEIAPHNETDINSTDPSIEETETKPALSGNPRIDYVFDPNLPRELNGYNLSSYPFYATVPPPEEFDFKCDGLHDGFYASIPHKCQVYHHCLYGTRYDFLCANYTAFDQKTFICQFVSVVDCDNSAKYFHRNDALYQAATTTTTSTTTTTTVAPKTTQPPPSGPGGARRPGYRRRNPSRRRRPQYDYYDDKEDYEDYYDDEPVRGRGNRKRPQRPRRPEYDEYDDEYDARYDRRYNRRPGGRRPVEEDRPVAGRRPVEEDRPVAGRRPLEEDRPVAGRRPSEDRRKGYDDKDIPRKPVVDDVDTDERRSFDDRRRPYDDDYDRRPYNERRRRPYDDRRGSSDEDGFERRRPTENDRRRRPVKDYDEETPKPQITPMSSSSVFSKPRAPPIIRRPVPLSERDKYDYTSPATQQTSKPASSAKDMEYIDDYEDEPPRPPKRKHATDAPPRYATNRPRVKKPIDDEEEPIRRPQDEPIRKRPSSEDYDEPRKRRPSYEDEPVDENRFRKPPRVSSTTIRPKTTTRATTTTVRVTTKLPLPDEDYYDDVYEDINPIKPTERLNEKALATTEKRETVTEGRSTKNENPLPNNNNKSYVKIVKRPFLPSRGGNPLAARGLSPVGIRAQEVSTEPPTSKPHSDDYYDNAKYQTEAPETSTFRINLRGNFNVGTRASTEAPKPQEPFRGSSQYNPTSYEQNLYRDTTPKVKDSINSVKNPLDLIEGEYDVTLNDALNPTIPNLPNRPSGFLIPRDDYSYSGYQRSRYVNYEPLNQASSDFTYQVQEPHHGNTRQVQQYQPSQFLPQYHNYNTRTVRGHHQYTSNF